jgi:hypothetical protein
VIAVGPAPLLPAELLTTEELLAEALVVDEATVAEEPAPEAVWEDPPLPEEPAALPALAWVSTAPLHAATRPAAPSHRIPFRTTAAATRRGYHVRFASVPCFTSIKGGMHHRNWRPCLFCGQKRVLHFDGIPTGRHRRGARHRAMLERVRPRRGR